MNYVYGKYWVYSLKEATVIYKIFETKSSFPDKQRTTGKVQFLLFKRFLLILAKLSFWEEDWQLGSLLKLRKHKIQQILQENDIGRIAFNSFSSIVACDIETSHLT